MSDFRLSKIEEKANQSVGRAVGFSAFAIGFLGLGLSFEPVMAAKAVAILTTILALSLMGFAERARHKRVSETETWVLLERHERPSPDVAQHVVGGAIRMAFLRFARVSCILAIGFWSVTLLLQVGRSLV